MKILAITGIRSEYDYLHPVLDELRKAKHKVKIVVSGAHLSHHYNDTWKLIKKDKFIISDKIDSLLSTNRLTQRSKAVGILLNGLSQAVERENPDILIVVGDREESIATAIVGNYMHKLVVHIGGGDPAAGNADDPLRFAVSKLSHVHCCTSLLYKKNLIKIGEESFRIFNTGSPSYVNIDSVKKINILKLLSKLNIKHSKKKYLILIKHPLSSEIDQSYIQMKKSLEAIKFFCLKSNFNTICIAPNSDPGSYEMIKAVKEYIDEEWFNYLETLPRLEFINLIRNASALVGNSSMGLLEAPHYKLPVVNIGKRQLGRLNAGNVRFTNYNKSKIVKELEKACFDKKYLNKIKNLVNPYGDKTAPKKIRIAIESINLNDQKWYVKKNLC